MNVSMKVSKNGKLVVPAHILKAVAKKAKDAIISRTRSGKDINKNDFAPYTKRYAAKRSKMGFGTRVVDLTITGGLLNGIRTRSNYNSVTLYLVGKYRKIADGLSTKRKFFGLTDSDFSRIYNQVVR